MDNKNSQKYNNKIKRKIVMVVIVIMTLTLDRFKKKRIKLIMKKKVIKPRNSLKKQKTK